MCKVSLLFSAFKMCTVSLSFRAFRTWGNGLRPRDAQTRDSGVRQAVRQAVWARLPGHSRATPWFAYEYKTRHITETLHVILII